jgi:uncharacterized membrane protein
MDTNTLLFLHLLGAFLFTSGALAAAILRVTAMRRERPSEIAPLLKAARPLVPVIGVGLVVAIVFGALLAHHLDISLGSGWLVATLCLLGWTIAVGGITGRQDRHTRELAERLSASDDAPDEALSSRLHDPINLWLSASVLVGTLAIVALMVWRP